MIPPPFGPPGDNVTNLIFSVIDKKGQLARVFVPGKPFQHHLMFASKTRPNSSLVLLSLGEYLQPNLLFVVKAKVLHYEARICMSY